MRARRAAQGQANFGAFDAHGDFVLRPGERKPNSLFTGQQGTLREFLQNRRELRFGELAVAVIALRRGLP